MSGPFPPSDTFITPIITEMTNILTGQIGGITTIYPTPPSGPPDDGGVVVMLSRGHNSTATIGRLEQTLTFVIMHFFRFNDTANAYNTCYAYIPSYLQAYEAWGNQRLNNKAKSVTVKDYGVAQHGYAGQPYLVLGFTIDVKTELPTPTT